MNTAYLFYAKGNYETALSMAKNAMTVIEGKKRMNKADRKIYLAGQVILMEKLLNHAAHNMKGFYETEQDKEILSRDQELAKKIYSAYRTLTSAACDVGWAMPRVARNELPQRVRETIDSDNYDAIDDLAKIVRKALPALETIVVDLETLRNLYKED